MSSKKKSSGGGGNEDYLSILEGLNSQGDKTKSKDARKLQQQTDDAAMQRLQKQLDAQMALQHQQHQDDLPIQAGQLTGTYNGSPTLAAKQADYDNQLKTVDQQQRKAQQDFDQAMSSKNYELANRIQSEQTRLQGVQVDLQRQKQDNDAMIQKAQTSGYMNGGQLTEAARAARTQEADRQANTTGYTSTGGLTETARAQRAQEAAQLATSVGHTTTGEMTEAARQARAQEAAQLATSVGHTATGEMTETARAQRAQEEAQRVSAMGHSSTGELTEAARQARAQELAQHSITSGYMDNGNLTEAAREARQNDAINRGQSTGTYTDPITGQSVTTDSSRQWQTNAGLQYAQTAAQLRANPKDYYQADAYITGAQASGIPNIVSQMDPNTGVFRSVQSGLPQNGSPQDIGIGTGTHYPTPDQSPVNGPPPTGIDGIPQMMTKPPPQQGGGQFSDGVYHATDMGPTEADRAAQFGNGVYQPQGNMVSADSMMGASPTEAERAARAGIPMMAMANQAPQGGETAPSASVGAAQQASAGNGGFYTSSMNQPVPQMAFGPAQQAPTGGETPPGQQPMPPIQQQPSNTGFSAGAQAKLNAYAPMFQAGAHKLAPGSMESMNPTQLGLFNSAARASGVDPESFGSQYKRSRLQTGGSYSQF